MRSQKFNWIAVQLACITVHLESVPELQNLLLNYEAMSKRLTAIEQVKNSNRLGGEPLIKRFLGIKETQERSSTHPPAQAVVGQQVEILEYQTTIANMTQHILTLEEKLSRLVTRLQLSSHFRAEHNCPTNHL